MASPENSIHEEAAAFAKRVFEVHGVIVHGIRFRWSDASCPARSMAIVQGVEMETETKPRIACEAKGGE